MATKNSDTFNDAALQRSLLAFGGRLIELMRLYRFETEGEFAAHLGIHPNTLTRYKKGEGSPDLKFITKLCDEFAVSIGWLLGGDNRTIEEDRKMRGLAPDGSVIPGTTPRPPMIVPPDEAAEEDEEASTAGGVVHLPRYEIRAAAGAGALATVESVNTYVTVERDWLRRVMPTWATADRAGILEVDGDSMEKTLWKGDLVVTFADPPERVVDNGGIFVVLHHGHLRVKRLHVDMRSGDISLISDNEKYPVEVVERQYLEHDLKILAMVAIRIGELRS